MLEVKAKTYVNNLVTSGHTKASFSEILGGFLNNHHNRAAYSNAAITGQYTLRNTMNYNAARSNI